MNIVVLGSGGREHAIAWALSKSSRCDDLFVIPGNGGTQSIAQNITGIDISDGAAIVGFAHAHDVGLVVVGPEVPLVAGVANTLRDAGIAVFGPDAQGAQLEGSKLASKRFMEENNLPTARYATFTEKELALE